MKSLTNRNFDRNIRRSKYAAVLFFANCCGPCKMAKEIFVRASQARKNVSFFTVNADDEELLAKRCHVEILPAILFFSQGEITVARYGISAGKSIEDTLDSLIK